MVTVMTDLREHVISVTVHGSPAPQGSKSFKGFAGGRARLVESSKHVKPWRDAVRADALLARNAWTAEHGRWEPLDGPLVVAMTFTLPKPAAAPKRRRIWPMRMPDVSKLARSTEDAFTDAGIWKDDARVVGYDRLWKVYPGEGVDALDSPGAVIHVYRLVEL